MRRLAICLALATVSGAAQAGDRITARPMLPETPREKQGEVATPAPIGLQAGQSLYSAAGAVAGRIEEVVRDKEGLPVRVILTTPDGRKRYAAAEDLHVEGRRVVTNLSTAQIQALPEVSAG